MDFLRFLGAWAAGIVALIAGLVALSLFIQGKIMGGIVAMIVAAASIYWRAKTTTRLQGKWLANK